MEIDPADSGGGIAYYRGNHHLFRDKPSRQVNYPAIYTRYAYRGDDNACNGQASEDDCRRDDAAHYRSSHDRGAHDHSARDDCARDRAARDHSSHND